MWCMQTELWPCTLSVSTIQRMSPDASSSPSFFFHSTIFPYIKHDFVSLKQVMHIALSFDVLSDPWQWLLSLKTCMLPVTIAKYVSKVTESKTCLAWHTGGASHKSRISQLHSNAWLSECASFFYLIHGWWQRWHSQLGMSRQVSKASYADKLWAERHQHSDPVWLLWRGDARGEAPAACLCSCTQPSQWQEQNAFTAGCS